MGKDYYIFSNGRIKRQDNTVYFINEETDRKALPIEQIDQIHIFGEVDMNTKLLNYISQYGISLHFYNYYGFYSGTYYSRKKNVSGYINIKQSMYYFFEERRLYIAKEFIYSAAHHILRILRRHKEKVNEHIEAIEILKLSIDNVKSINALMGVEGLIRKEYYRAFDKITKKFEFEKREKRPPKDPINTLISFGNSVMYNIVLGEIYKTQLDPTISFLHEPSTKRFSLSLDIAEIFKPLIVDSTIISSINNNIITEDSFVYEGDICLLNDMGKKRFIAELEKKLDTTIMHRTLNRKVSYRMFIRLECYKIIKHIIDDETYKSLRAWW